MKLLLLSLVLFHQLAASSFAVAQSSLEARQRAREIAARSAGIDKALSKEMPDELKALPIFGEIEWTQEELPFVEKGPHAGISGAGMVSIDGQIYLVGGFIPAGDDTEDVSRRTSRWAHRFDPKSKQWTKLPDLPARREYTRAVAVDKVVYVMGGAIQGKPTMPAAEVFHLDVTQKPIQWQTSPSLTVPRTHMAVGQVGQWLIAAGGNRYDIAEKGYSPKTIQSVTDVLDLTKTEQGWKRCSPIPGSPRGWSASAVVNDRFYMLGGVTWPSSARQRLNETLSYEPSGNTWTPMANFPYAISGWEADTFQDRYIIAVGGAGARWNDIPFVYDTQTDRWMRTTNPIPPGAFFNDPGVCIVDDTIYVAGGEGSGGSHFNHFMIGKIKQLSLAESGASPKPINNPPASSIAAPEMMLNLDGDLSFVGDTPSQSTTKLQKLIDDIANCGVQTLMFSIGAGSDILYYQTTVASTWGWRETTYDSKPEWKNRIQRCREATQAGLDAPRIAGEQALKKGMRFVPSYRMNDAHYGSDPLNHPLTGRFWIEHQDCEIGFTPVPGVDVYSHLLDFSRNEVRSYRLAIIMEAIDRYADIMDGFELDFNRFQIFFPAGSVESNAHQLTEIIEKVRHRLNELGNAAGRRLRLIVRVPPSLHNCRWSGLDVESWIEHRLVDAVIPAQVMTLSHDMPLDEFQRIARPVGCRVIGSIYGRSGYSWPFTSQHDHTAYANEVSRTPELSQVIGSVGNQLYLGAEGIQLYNFNFSQSAPTFMSSVCNAVRNPRSILKQDRRYQVTPAYFHDNEDSYEYRKQLPKPLTIEDPIRLKILIGENPKQSPTSLPWIALRLGIHGANKAYDDTSLSIVINGHCLLNGTTSKHLVITTGKRHGNGSHPPPTEAYVQLRIDDASILNTGWNSVEVTRLPSKQSSKLQLVEAEISILAEPSVR